MMDSTYLMLRHFEYKKQKKKKLPNDIKSNGKSGNVTRNTGKKVMFTIPELCEALHE